MCSTPHANPAKHAGDPVSPWNPNWPAAGPWGRALAQPFVWLILLYRLTLSPIIGNQCRFEPTCSRYGLGAYRTYGPIRGTWLTARRIVRCRPFGPRGYDPVPVPRSGGSGGTNA